MSSLRISQAAHRRQESVVLVATILGLLGALAGASNPIVRNVSIADPHIHIFDDVAYMYAGRDLNPHAPFFDMPDWHVWTSTDLVHWRMVNTIFPNQTYMGDSTACWAVDVARVAQNEFRFFFSNHNIDTGLMKASLPSLSDAKDALGRPLVTQAMTGNRTLPYDPTVLVQGTLPRKGSATSVAGNLTVHLLLGLHQPANNRPYMIARLNGAADGLAEPLRPVVFLPRADGATQSSDDKPTLHLRDGVFYLSSGTVYSTSDNVYGPYTFRGSTGPALEDRPHRNYGLTVQAHGRYFTWKSQWFHVWCEFISQNNTALEAASHLSGPLRKKGYYAYRDSWMTYTHYRQNGAMIDDVAFLDQDTGRLGVGQYDAKWARVEAEWYMQAAVGATKVELDASLPGKNDSAATFGVQFAQPDSFIRFPYFHGLVAPGETPSTPPGTLTARVDSCAGTPDKPVALQLIAVSKGGSPVVLASVNCSSTRRSPFTTATPIAWPTESLPATPTLELRLHAADAAHGILLDWFSLS